MLKILTNNRLFFLIFCFWVLISALLQVFFSQKEIMFWVNERHNFVEDIFFRWITLWGEDYVWLILLFFLWLSGKKNKLMPFQKIQFVAIAWLCKVLVSVGLKNLFLLPRPMEVFKDIASEIHLVEGVKIAYWQSFPSGHTMTAFAFATICMLQLKNKYWSVLALLAALAVAYSRVYLFQHFPRDVFSGSILGICVVLFLKMWKFREEDI